MVAACTYGTGKSHEIFTESLAREREKRRQILVVAETLEKARVELLQTNARAHRSEKVPLIECQSEAQFRLESNVMVRACNSDSGTVELNAGWLRPAVLEDSSDASGSATVRLYCSKGFLRNYVLYQFDEELLDQKHDDVKEKLLRFIFDQPLSQEKKIEFWKACDGMIELADRLIPVQVLEAPIPDERGQEYEDMVLVLTVEQKTIRLSIQELFA